MPRKATCIVDAQQWHCSLLQAFEAGKDHREPCVSQVKRCDLDWLMVALVVTLAIDCRKRNDGASTGKAMTKPLLRFRVVP